LVAGQFGFESLDDLGAVLGLAFGLARVEADDIPPSPFPLPYEHLLGEEIMLERAIPPGST
jgi:hypothetical protein